jgi:hypothetical protein
MARQGLLVGERLELYRARLDSANASRLPRADASCRVDLERVSRGQEHGSLDRNPGWQGVVRQANGP